MSDMESWILSRLREIEERPEMWGSPEGVEATYVTLLEVLLKNHGISDTMAVVGRAYSEIHAAHLPMVGSAVPFFAVCGFTRNEAGDRVYDKNSYNNVMMNLCALKEKVLTLK